MLRTICLAFCLNICSSLAKKLSLHLKLMRSFFLIFYNITSNTEHTWKVTVLLFSKRNYNSRKYLYASHLPRNVCSIININWVMNACLQMHRLIKILILKRNWILNLLLVRYTIGHFIYELAIPSDLTMWITMNWTCWNG